jgi:hypothetical protein
VRPRIKWQKSDLVAELALQVPALPAFILLLQHVLLRGADDFAATSLTLRRGQRRLSWGYVLNHLVSPLMVAIRALALGADDCEARR